MSSSTSVETGSAPAAPAAALEFAGVGKSFPMPSGERREVLGDISFSVMQNQFVVLVGPSGCGKSTLLQIATGLDRPTRGEVRCMGAPLRGVNPDIGYVTQQANLFPWYTLRQNVELPLTLRAVPRRERDERVREYLDLAGLTGFEDAYPDQLSGGMQKRASILRTLIYAPPIVLMDEPFGSLDAQTRMIMQEYLLEMWSQRRTTVLFVTHDLTEAVVLADNVILLTHQPTTIKEDISVSVPRPRNVYEPYQMEGFLADHERVWEGFKSEMLPVGRRDDDRA
jgi:NitT/TauT family transport system ATP-binding protein